MTQKPITRQKGYFIQGKFDQFNRNVPFSAFVQAFRSLMGQLLGESDLALESWKEKILEAVGESGQVILEVIPELERIIGTQPPVPELSGSAAQNRFNLLFGKFIQVFTTKEHPLVIFLDDLQWADSASLQLIKLLMNDSGYLLMLGAYRDNEVFPAHPLVLTVEELKKAEAIIETITLSPLDENTVNQLVADTLSCTPELARPLTRLIFQKTQGNPFFTTQFLKALHEDGYITFDMNRRYWQCDIAQVKRLALTNDVVEFIALQLQKLPDQTQQLLKLAACIGNQFDLNTLAIVSEQSATEAATALWKALKEGLILPKSQIYKFFQDLEATEANVNPTYRFLHDRVQQAGYSLIPDDQKQATHLKIGQLLLQDLSQTEQEEKLFDIVSHLNRGQALITQRQERENLVRLNLKAGAKARNTTAYAAAREYLQTGIELLEANCWQHQYELTLDLYVAATEASYLNSDFTAMEQFAALVLQQAQTIFDKVKIYEIQIAAQASQSQILAAITVGREALAQLGVEFPAEVEEAKIGQALQDLKAQLGGREIAELIDLPTMSDRNAHAAIQLLSMLFAPVLLGSPDLLPLLGTTMVRLSLEFGNAPASTVGYATHGMVLCSFFAEVEAGYEFGSLALSLMEKLNAQSMKCMTLNLFAGFIHHHRQAFSDGLPLLKECYRSGMETGVFFYAAYGIQGYGYTALFVGADLDTLASDLDVYSTSLAQIKQESALIYLNMLRQTVHHLRETVSQPDRLIGTFYDETELFAKHQQDGDLTGLGFAHIYKLQLAYTFGNDLAALDYIKQGKTYLVAVSGAHHVPIFHFYAALTYLALVPTQPEQGELLAEAETYYTTLHQWADNAPMNHLHKWYLVKAEKHRVLGENAAAIEHYDEAIALAKQYQYMNEAALANELAAKFYLDWGKEKVAAVYMQEAYYCYARWGAKAKTNHLERRYPELLQPILQPVVSSTHWLDSLSNLAPAKVSVHSTGTVSSASGTNINATLDFASVLKSSQAISDIIQLDDLLRELTRIMLQASGGDRCVLALPNENGIWQVSAIASSDTIKLYAEPLAESQNAPIQLIHYVKNTHEAVVIDNLATDLPIIDAYLHQHQPQSVVCLPMLHHDTVVGVLYLHNQFTCGAFTSDRILIVNFLCTQAAISIQNSCLYKELGRSLQDAQQKSQDLAEIVALSNGQQRILALIAQGVPLNRILEETARHIESQSRHRAYCSFLGLDSEGRLRHLAGPCLPPAYNALVDGIKIGPEVGSCGTAAYRKASVTVEDIANDPLWANFQIALEYGLRACASTPILGSQGEVLATLAMYQPEPGEFTLHDRKLIEAATYLARIAIERHQADLEVQNLNFQMIQSEKMASLGNLVAGVAHEINNPIGFLNGSISNGKEYVQDLLEHLALYQQHYPNLADAIQDNAEEIDLEFLLEDLPQLLDAMQRASDRIQGISTSLRTFSRADTDHKVRANLHDGLDSTLLILKYRLKANEHRPEIEVIQDYGNLPEIDCFPGQLNQVFMNILANAIDAFDEVAQLSSFAELKDQRQIITIQTVLTEQKTVEIRIRDNGKGMPEEVKNKIFDHLFTTKGVGKGTGLGLSISRQIIEEKHGGKLACISALGAGTEFVISLPRREN